MIMLLEIIFYPNLISVAGPGFVTWGWVPTPEPIIIWQDFVENCMRMKEIGQRGAGAPTPPPDPPLLLFVKYPCNTYNSYFIIFYSNLISVAGPGFVTRNGGCQRQSLLLFGKISVKNCMRTKEI